MDTLNTTAAVISALGGTAKVARALGKNQTAVCNWVARNKFPDELNTYFALQRLLKRNRLAVSPSLWGLDEEPSAMRKRA